MSRSIWAKLVIVGLLAIMATVVVARSGNECGENCGVGALDPTVTVHAIDPAAATVLISSRQSDPSFAILDLRTPAEYAAEHIAGAVNMDYYSADFRAELSAWDRTGTYLVYSTTAQQGALAIPAFNEMGFVDIFYILGGIASWKDAGLPTVTDGQ